MGHAILIQILISQDVNQITLASQAGSLLCGQHGFEPRPEQLLRGDIEQVLRTQLLCNTTASAPESISAILNFPLEGRYRRSVVL